MVCCVYVWAVDVVFSVQNKMERTTTKRCKHIAVRTCIYPYNMKVVNIMRCNMSCRIISPQQTIGIPLFYFISCSSTIHRLLAAQLDGPTMPQEKERYRQCFYGCFWVNRIYIITYTLHCHDCWWDVERQWFVGLVYTRTAIHTLCNTTKTVAAITGNNFRTFTWIQSH